jgi:hypothetical protein
MSNLPPNEIHNPDFLSDEWLLNWYGKDFFDDEESMVAELDAIDLLESAQ